MKKIFFKKAVSMIAALALTAGLCGCGGAKKVSIEVDETKVTVEVDEKTSVKIKNYDELKDVSVEIDDDDIAKIKESNGKITITGLEEGKAKITVTASNSDDEITIKVKVKEEEKPEPEPEPEPEPWTDPEPDPEPYTSGDADDWYGTYSGNITLSGTGKWEDQYYHWDDVYALVSEGEDKDGNERAYFEAFSDDMDLWDIDWSQYNNDPYPIFSFWVDLTPDMMECDLKDEAWMLDDNDPSDTEYAFWWSAAERDSSSGMFMCYDYYDPKEDGGFDVYIYLYKD